MDILTLAMIGGTAVIGTIWGYVEVRRSGRTYRFINRLRQEKPFYLSDRWYPIAYQWQAIGEKAATQWARSIVFLGHKRLALYPTPPQDESPAILSIAPHELRGFWRPLAYHSGDNLIEIHAQMGLSWGILRLKLPQYEMHKFIRAIKEVSSPEQIKAYRRQRPYPQKGLSPALPAEQNLTGEWVLFNPIELYLMPLHLVVFKQGEMQQVFDLEQVQQIAALKRMEGGKPEGLIRFTYDSKVYAFALEDYEAWADSLAEAAKRSLEEPVMRKQKSKDEEDAWDDVDDEG